MSIQRVRGHQVYLVFGGGETAYAGEVATIEKVSIAPSGISPSIIAGIVKKLNQLFHGKISFAAERPDTTDYSTIYIGHTDAFNILGRFRGLAEKIGVDGGRAFVLLSAVDRVHDIVEVIAHETRHLLCGFRHAGSGINAYAAAVTVSAGDLISGMLIMSGSSAYVYGVTEYTTISSGGREYVCSGGWTIGTTVLSSGVQLVSSGGWTWGTTISGGANQLVYSGGRAVSSVISSGGSQTIYDGGVAFSTYINSGSQTISGGCVVSAFMDHGTQSVSSGGVAIGTRLYKTCDQYIRSGGIAIDTNLSGTNNAAVAQIVFNGGLASNTRINNGWLRVDSGGMAISGAAGYQGHIIIHSLGTVKDARILNGGYMVLYPGAILSGTIVLDDGELNYSQGGLNSATDVDIEVICGYDGLAGHIRNIDYAHDTEDIKAKLLDSSSHGHFRIADFCSNFAGDISVCIGGSSYSVAIASGADTSSSVLTYSGIAYSMYKSNNAIYLDALDGYTRIPTGGTMTDIGGSSNFWVYSANCRAQGGTSISNGIIIGDAHIGMFGTQVSVDQSASAINIELLGSGQMLVAGIASSSIVNGGIQTIGGMAINTMLLCGREIVNGSATGTIISGGSQIVESGGFAMGTCISGGVQFISEGGIASGTTISDGKIVLAGGNFVLASGTSQYIGHNIEFNILYSTSPDDDPMWSDLTVIQSGTTILSLEVDDLANNGRYILAGNATDFSSRFGGLHITVDPIAYDTDDFVLTLENIYFAPDDRVWTLSLENSALVLTVSDGMPTWHPLLFTMPDGPQQIVSYQSGNNIICDSAYAIDSANNAVAFTSGGIYNEDIYGTTTNATKNIWYHLDSAHVSGSIYGGCSSDAILDGNVNIEVVNSDIAALYAGGSRGTLNGNVNIEMVNSDIAALYAAGSSVTLNGNVNIEVVNSDITALYAGGSSGVLNGNVIVYLNGGHTTKLYGGGSGTQVSGNILLNIANCSSDFQTIYLCGSIDFSYGGQTATLIMSDVASFHGAIYGGYEDRSPNTYSLRAISMSFSSVNIGSSVNVSSDCVFGGSFCADGVFDYIEATAEVTVDGNSFINTLAGGSYATGNAFGYVENVLITINGGAIRHLYGGGYSESGSTAHVGSVNMTLNGGTYYDVAVGGYANGGTTAADNVYLTVDTSTCDATFYKSINMTMAGNGSMDVFGNVNATFTGNGDSLAFVQAAAVVDATGAGTSVRGHKNLNFVDFSGKFGASLANFTALTFDAGSHVVFTKNANFSPFTTFNFELDQETSSGAIWEQDCTSIMGIDTASVDRNLIVDEDFLDDASITASSGSFLLIDYSSAGTSLDFSADVFRLTMGGYTPGSLTTAASVDMGDYQFTLNHDTSNKTLALEWEKI
ncbi:MAG: hypothetical protein VB042_02995 [Victivallaceae bacterium]|nr:hypothetical protein [Victivallaceae bacterium]